MTENQETDSKVVPVISGIRQNLVDTAVNFLLNSDVVSKPEQSKVTFLKNKGLTDAEISLAFNKAKSDPRHNDKQNFELAPALPYSPSKPSFWFRLRQFSSSFIILAVALYGLHQFYKLYIEPWLFGTKYEKSKLSQMEEQLQTLNNSIVNLSGTVSTLEKSINSHKVQIDKMIEANGYVSSSVAITSLKSEIGAVKSLLINRHQFPAVPKVVTPSIPHWQLASNENENTEDESKTESTSDSVSLNKETEKDGDQSTNFTSSLTVENENVESEDINSTLNNGEVLANEEQHESAE